VLAIDLAIDAIDESINPIDEKLNSGSLRKVFAGDAWKPADKSQLLPGS
jgi:hypothetical protein